MLLLMTFLFANHWKFWRILCKNWEALFTLLCFF